MTFMTETYGKIEFINILILFLLLFNSELTVNCLV